MQTFRKIDAAISYALGDASKIMFWIFASVAFSACLIYEKQAAFFPYQLDYGEAPLVDQAMRLANGQNIYRADISTPPYTISNYPPLYVALLSLSVKLMGPSATFVVGRLLSIISMWAAGLCIVWILYSGTRDHFAAGVGGAVLFAFPYVVTWSPLLRIDSLALALSLGGLTMLVTRPTSTRHLIIASFFLVAAIYTRQSYALAAPFAGFVWLFSHEKRKAFYLAALVGGLSLILFLILNALTHGGFYFNIVTANVNQFKMDNLKYHWHRLLEIGLILLIFGGISLCLVRRWNPLWMLAAPYLIASLVSAATIGKIGSNVNYLLELCAALSLAAGAVIAASQKYLPIQSLRAVLIIVLALAVARLLHFTVQDYTRDLMDRRASTEELDNLAALVEQTKGNILIDEYMSMLTRLGRPLVIQPFEVTQLAWAGEWDQAPLLKGIRNHEYAAIIIYDRPWQRERWTQEMFNAINSSYRVSEIIADNKVYVPYQLTSTEILKTCPGALWQLPGDGTLGLQVEGDGINFFGHGNAGKVPVYAVSDGYLLRLPEWFDSVAVQHTDPLHAENVVWSYYSGMAAANEIDSYVSQDFPLGSEHVPVKAGQLLGYEGTWSGRRQWSMWVHLHFAVIAASKEGDFPEDITLAHFVDPTLYLGLNTQHLNSQSLKCSQQ